MIKIGTRRSIDGGGGSGGNTSGNTRSATVRTAITAADLQLKHLIIVNLRGEALIVFVISDDVVVAVGL
ncbi:hypothetical protein U1Q18_007774 [Sarracenia purpurea var. burkii]